MFWSDLFLHYHPKVLLSDGTAKFICTLLLTTRKIYRNINPKAHSLFHCWQHIHRDNVEPILIRIIIKWTHWRLTHKIIRIYKFDKYIYSILHIYKESWNTSILYHKFTSCSENNSSPHGIHFEWHFYPRIF